MEANSLRLFTRIRGQVQGPFDYEQLRSLIKRGMLARVHEVSENSRDWVRADESGALFCAATPGKGVDPADWESLEADQNVETSAGGERFYYLENGAVVGPVTAGYLQALLDNNRLVANDLLCLEGTEEWNPILSFGIFSPNPFAIRQVGEPRLQHSAEGFSRAALASLLLGIFWLCGAGSLAAVVLGIIAERRIAASGGRLTGRGVAWAGICLGILGVGAAGIGLAVVLYDYWGFA